MMLTGAATAAAGTSDVFFARDLNPAPDQATRRLTPIPLAQQLKTQAARTAFLAGLPAGSINETESFEGETVGSTGPLMFDFFEGGDPADDVSATLTGGLVVKEGVAGPPDFPAGQGRYPVTGTKWLEVDSGDTMTLTFDQPVKAFGFFAYDVNDVNNSLGLEVKLMSKGAVLESVQIDPADDTDGGTGPADPVSGQFPKLEGNLIFWGIISDVPFEEVVFSNILNDPNLPDFDIFAFDDFIISTEAERVIIPLPTPLGLGLAGLGCLAAIRRRR